jgi:hypothetical protein
MVLVASWPGHGPSGTVQPRVTYVPWQVKQQGESLRPPIRTMTARAAAALPDADRARDYAFEPKADGWLD